MPGPVNEECVRRGADRLGSRGSNSDTAFGFVCPALLSVPKQAFRAAFVLCLVSLQFTCLGAGRQGSEVPKQLRLLTFNVLSLHPGQLDRSAALLEEIRRSQADVIGLQEVRPRFLKALAAFAREQGLHLLRDPNGRPWAPRALCMLSRFPIGRVEFSRLPGPQKRGLLLARVDLPDARGSLVVVNLHLESPLHAYGIRRRQLKAAHQATRRFLNGKGGLGNDGAPKTESKSDAATVVWLADLNFGDGAREQSALPVDYLDAWRSLYPHAPGYTYRPGTNALAARHALPGEKARRLDRILVRSAIWKPLGAGLLVREGRSRSPASDHAALLVVLGMRKEL